jgi:hypothetical protein
MTATPNPAPDDASTVAPAATEQDSRRWAVAVATALSAGGLWIGSGVLNRVLLWNQEAVPYQLVDLLVPAALNFNLRPGEYQVSLLAAASAVVVAVVAGGISHLAARGLPAGAGSLPLFLAVWFAAVAASSVGAAVQVVDAFFSDWNSQVLAATVNGLIPYLTGGGWWGVALGWIVGLTAVCVRRRVMRAHR